MDAQAFWNVIGTYNQKTIIIQFVLLFMIAAGVIIARTNKKIVWTEKAVLGGAHLFIGIVFFWNIRHRTCPKVFCNAFISYMRNSFFV